MCVNSVDAAVSHQKGSDLEKDGLQQCTGEESTLQHLGTNIQTHTSSGLNRGKQLTKQKEK